MNVDIYQLAQNATDALLEQKLITVYHEPGWDSDGFPKPVKQFSVMSDGSVVQEYQPSDILNYVQEILNGKNTIKKISECKVDHSYKNIGRFKIAGNLLREHSCLLQKIYSSIIPINVASYYDTFYITALSEEFRDIVDDEIIPEYDVIIKNNPFGYLINFEEIL